MFNIGGGEFLVIALIALIVLGPQRLPDAARQVGKAMGELRRLSSGFQSELKSAFDESERASAPPRDVLGAAGGPAPVEEGSVVAAEQAVPEVTGGPDETARPARPRRRAPLRADPVPDAGSPRSNGS
ncbi:MAG: Sec-independent protein translocase protein TatB [Actinomycetota bacterium]